MEEVWFVLDSAPLHVRQPGRVKPGEAHTVEVEIAPRLPYIFVGPGKCLVMTTSFADKQVAIEDPVENGAGGGGR